MNKWMKVPLYSRITNQPPMQRTQISCLIKVSIYRVTHKGWDFNNNNKRFTLLTIIRSWNFVFCLESIINNILNDLRGKNTSTVWMLYVHGCRVIIGLHSFSLQYRETLCSINDIKLKHIDPDCYKKLYLIRILHFYIFLYWAIFLKPYYTFF